MTIVICCLFIAVLLSVFSKFPVVYAIKQLGAYDNSHPREQQARLHGFGARALAGHQNSFESLIVFSTATLAALATHHITLTVEILSITYIVSRLIYHVFYLLNWAGLRSLIWAIGYLACLIILGSCIY